MSAENVFPVYLSVKLLVCHVITGETTVAVQKNKLLSALANKVNQDKRTTKTDQISKGYHIKSINQSNGSNQSINQLIGSDQSINQSNGSNQSIEWIQSINQSIEWIQSINQAKWSVIPVRDVETTVHGALHHGKKLGPRGGTAEPDVQITLERARFAGDILHVRLLAVDLRDAFIDLVQLQLLQKLKTDNANLRKKHCGVQKSSKCRRKKTNPTSQQKTGGIGSSVIRQTVLDAIAHQLVRVGRGKDLISLDGSPNDLQDTTHKTELKHWTNFPSERATYLNADVLVGETGDDAVLRCVVFVLVLGDQTLARLIVGLSLCKNHKKLTWKRGESLEREKSLTPSSTEFHLEPLEVRLALDNLDENLQRFRCCNPCSSSICILHVLGCGEYEPLWMMKNFQDPKHGKKKGNCWQSENRKCSVCASRRARLMQAIRTPYVMSLQGAGLKLVQGT